MLLQKKALTTKIHLFGRQLVAQQGNSNLKFESKPGWYIIMPEGKFKTMWNITVIILLAYTSTIVPFQVAFVDVDSSFASFLNYLVDVLFGIDIIVNFLSAYEENHRIEVRFKNIFKNYISGWFFIDLVATFPTQILIKAEENTGVNKLARLARLPRLYRLFRVLRIFKIFKLFKYNKKFQQWFGYLNLGATATKMVKLAMFGIFLIHLFSCIWYLTAKLDDLADDTWVVRKGLIQADTVLLYLESIYWAVQVLTTVGYGDFGAQTTAEYIINLIWMLVGVGYYQIIFGQIISIITAHSSNASMLDNKLKALEDFSKETKLYEEDEELQNQIRQFLINNYLELYAKIDEEKLLQELPLSLREEILYRQYGGLVETIKVLRDSTDNEFVWAMVQIANKIAFEKDDTIYWQGDFSENIYMIYKGRVSLYAQNGYVFQSYSEGELLGDSDALLDEVRDSKAIAQVNSTMYTVKMEHLDELFETYQEAQAHMMRLAMRKNAKHKKKIALIEKRFPVFGLLNIENADKDSKGPKGGAQESSLANKFKKGRDASYGEMMNFLDDIDQKFNLEEMQEKDLQDIQDFIRQRANMQHSKQIQGDGELTREIAMLLHQRTLQGNGTIDDLKGLLQDIKNIKSLYEMDTMALKSLDNDSPKTPNNQHLVQQDQPPSYFGRAMSPRQQQLQASTRSFEQNNELIAVRQQVKKLVEYQRIVEQDENLGMPEAQAALEIVNHFNEDMVTIQSNMNSLIQMMEGMSNINERQQQLVWNLEGKTIAQVERQVQVEKNCGVLMDKLGV